jgi:hypothetical protein
MKKLLFTLAVTLSVGLNAQINSPSGTMGISSPNVGIGTTTTVSGFGVHLLGGIGQAIPQGLYIQRADSPPTNQDCALGIQFSSNAFTGAGIGGGSCSFILTPSINTPAPDFAFSTNSVKPQFIIKNSGRIGINTVNPGDKLEINSGTNGRSGLRFSKLTALTATTATPGDFACNKVLTVDNNGEVILIDLSTCGSSSKIASTTDELMVLQNQIAILQQQITELQSIINETGVNGKLTGSTLPAMKIAPNPTTKHAEVTYTLPIETKSAFLIVTNMLGETVLQVQLNLDSNSTQINVEDLSPGTYINTLVSNGVNIASSQLIIAE